MEFKSIENQKATWAGGLKGHEGIGSYGAEWGDINSVKARNMRGDILGNYHHIQTHYLIPNITGKTVIDLGCLDGKWIVPMTWFANKIIGVDILPDGFERIKKWPGYDPAKIEFKLGTGYDLHHFGNKSIDYIFSMDVFPRTEIEVIDRYIGEFKRVLTDEGKACIHLPCQDQPLSHELGFTQLSIEQIQEMLVKHGFGIWSIDRQTINHGVLLLINIE